MGATLAAQSPGMVTQVSYTEALTYDLRESLELISTDDREDAASSSVSQAVGAQQEIEPHIEVTELPRGILLCSDGLSNYVSLSDLHRFMADKGLEEILRELTRLAIRKKSSDDITIIVGRPAE